jgi:hypothetical protein
MAKVQGCELAMVANQLFRMAGAENNKEIEIVALKAELEEVRKYFTKRVEFLESERGISYTKLKDEYSQHARYNTFKDIVQEKMGEAKLEEFNALKKKARVDAQPDFEAFCKRLKQGFQESKATAKALQEEHEAKVKKIHDDAEKEKATLESRRGGKAATNGAGRKAPGGEAKANPNQEKKPRPKTAPQIFNFEKETKEQYYAEKAASGKGKEFLTLVEWGNMKFKELPRERQEKYEAMALKARQELGLGPVVPRATPRAPAGGSKKADNNQATLAKVIEKKSRQPKEKQVRPKKKKKKDDDDSDDDDDSGDSEGEESDDASNPKRKSASQTENAAPASDEEEEEEEKEEEKEEEEEERKKEKKKQKTRPDKEEEEEEEEQEQEAEGEGERKPDGEDSDSSSD